MKPFKNLFQFIIICFLLITSYSCLKNLSDDDIEYTPEREQAIISDYIDSLNIKGYDVDTSGLGIYYVIIEEGEGAYPLPGDSIGIIYVGYFPENRNIFDSSDYWYQDAIWKFTYGSNDIIQGFYDAISLLNISSEGLFIIPSDKAYGPNGSYDGSIPPYTPLVFDIKLMDIYY